MGGDPGRIQRLGNLLWGGPNSNFSSQVAELGWLGRKFGIHMEFAAQDSDKQVVDRVRDQVNEVVCFKVRSAEAALAVGCQDEVRIPESRPGLACTDRWGPVQTFYLEKQDYAAFYLS